MRKITAVLIICVIFVFAIIISLKTETNVLASGQLGKVEFIDVRTLHIKETTLLIVETVYYDGSRDIYVTNINRVSRAGNNSNKRKPHMYEEEIYEGIGKRTESSETEFKHELICFGIRAENIYYSLTIPTIGSIDNFSLEIAEDLLNKLMAFQESCNQISYEPPEKGILPIEMEGVKILGRIYNIPGAYNLFVNQINYLIDQKYLMSINQEVYFFSQYLNNQASNAEKKEGRNFLESLLQIKWSTSDRTENSGKDQIREILRSMDL